RGERAGGVGIRPGARPRRPGAHVPTGVARRARHRGGGPGGGRRGGGAAALCAGAQAGRAPTSRAPPRAAAWRRVAARRDDAPQPRAGRAAAPRSRRGDPARSTRPHDDTDGGAFVAALAAGAARRPRGHPRATRRGGDRGEELARAVGERAPAQATDGDAIRVGYDRELDEVKDARDGGKQYIASLQARERERTGIASLKVGFNKVFGYYIEVTNPHKDRVPGDYERRQTLSGAERFVTPELKEYEAKVLGAEERIAAREAELVDALRARIALAIAR